VTAETCQTDRALGGRTCSGSGFGRVRLPTGRAFVTPSATSLHAAPRRTTGGLANIVVRPDDRSVVATVLAGSTDRSEPQPAPLVAVKESRQDSGVRVGGDRREGTGERVEGTGKRVVPPDRAGVGRQANYGARRAVRRRAHR
jgi:hypothetical protein